MGSVWQDESQTGQGWAQDELKIINLELGKFIFLSLIHQLSVRNGKCVTWKITSWAWTSNSQLNQSIVDSQMTRLLPRLIVIKQLKISNNVIATCWMQFKLRSTHGHHHHRCGIPWAIAKQHHTQTHIPHAWITAVLPIPMMNLKCTRGHPWGMVSGVGWNCSHLLTMDMAYTLDEKSRGFQCYIKPEPRSLVIIVWMSFPTSHTSLSLLIHCQNDHYYWNDPKCDCSIHMDMHQS